MELPEKKKATRGNTFAIFWLLTSVDETDSDYGVTGTRKKNVTSSSFIDKKVSAIS